MTATALPDMHDWTLLSVDFDWAHAVAESRFSPVGGGERTLRVSGVIDLHIPKHKFWGPSVSINRAEWELGRGNAVQTVRIEMQSGDVITVDAAAFDLE